MSEAEFDSYLSLLAKFLRLRSRQRADLADELRDHLDSRLEELLAAGKTRDEAVAVALEEFGDAALLATEFSRLASRRTRRFVMRCTAASAAVVAAVLLLSVALAPPGPHGPGPDHLVAQQAPGTDPNLIPGLPPSLEGIPATPEKTSVEQQAIAALDEKLAMSVMAVFEEVPLREVIHKIADDIEADALVDEKMIADSGANLDDPVTLRLTRSQVSARTVLEFLLEPRDLAVVNRSGVMFVTSPEMAEQLHVMKVYNVRDLIAGAPAETYEEWVPMSPGGRSGLGGGGGFGGGQGGTGGGGFFSVRDVATATLIGGVGQIGGSGGGIADEIVVDSSDLPLGAGEAPMNANSDVRKYRYRRHTFAGASGLLQAIQSTTSGPWFDIDGVGGTMAPYNGLLVVRQTEQVHAEIQKLLDALRAAGRQSPGGSVTVPKGAGISGLPGMAPGGDVAGGIPGLPAGGRSPEQ